MATQVLFIDGNHPALTRAGRINYIEHVMPTVSAFIGCCCPRTFP
jgi:hypothetical protein